MDFGKLNGVAGQGFGASVGKTAAGAATGAAAGPSFGDVLKTMVGQTVEAQHTAQDMSIAAAQGDQVALHEVVQAISRAELTLQTLVSVRDKAVEAYKEIMQMPV